MVRSRNSDEAMKTKVFFDGFDGHVRRSLERARRREKGERLEAERNKPLSSPVIVALIGSPKKEDNIVPQEEVVAAGAALQNMLLAAHSLGLAGFVRTGAHSYSGEVRTFFGMGEDETLIGMVYLGYASGTIPPGKRAPFRDKVSWLRD